MPILDIQDNYMVDIKYEIILVDRNYHLINIKNLKKKIHHPYTDIS